MPFLIPQNYFLNAVGANADQARPLNPVLSAAQPAVADRPHTAAAAAASLRHAALPDPSFPSQG